MNREMFSLTHNEHLEFVPASLKSRTAVRHTGQQISELIAGGAAHMTLRSDSQPVCH